MKLKRLSTTEKNNSNIKPKLSKVNSTVQLDHVNGNGPRLTPFIGRSATDWRVQQSITLLKYNIICVLWTKSKKSDYKTERTAEGSAFWRQQSVIFSLCMKYLGNRWTDLRQIYAENACLVPRSDEFEGHGQRSKVKVTRDKNGIFGPSAACVRFMFGKKSLASSFFLLFLTLL